MLYGKGVWAWQEPEVDLAIEMARAINATHILFKTGAGAFLQKNTLTQFYADAARRAIQKIAAAGLIPFAWIFVFGDDPEGEANVTLQTKNAGYRGMVFDMEDQAGGISAFCAGGFFPQAYATFGKSAEYTLGAMMHDRQWPAAWGPKPPLYPILGLYYDSQGDIRMAACDEPRLVASAQESRAVVLAENLVRPGLCDY